MPADGRDGAPGAAARPAGVAQTQRPPGEGPGGHDLVGLGEVMLRLAAPAPQRLAQAVALDVQIGGSEANVAAACARLGLRTAMLTALPADHPWGDRAVRELSAHGIDCRAIVRPVDTRLGLYFLEYGSAPRPVRVLYDRRDSAFSRLDPDAFDWALVRNARLLHVSGVTPALGENLRDVVRRAIREATAAGVPVSFDVNYRSRLWPPKDARDFLVEVLPAVRYLFIGSDDAATVFELPASWEAALVGLARLAPRATLALTMGEEGSAVLAEGRAWRPSRLYTVSVVDRVGAGDAYAAGFLWAQLTGRSVQEAVDAATALAALKCTIWGDIALVGRAELDELLISDNTEIRR
jgi:2-dehydro-3-deoxygluconokinase